MHDNNYEPFDLTGLNTYSLFDRPSKVTVDDFAAPLPPNSTIRDLLSSLPDQFMGRDFPDLVRRLAAVHQNNRPIFVGIGGHVIKVGLAPILIDLMKRSIISGLAVNGSVIVHDVELAIAGRTSEDVDKVLGDGAFGAAKETGELINQAIVEGASKNLGLGQAVGARLLADDYPHNEMSLLAVAADLNIPVTVHVALGADIIHLHPNACGASIGKTSLHDFRRFCSMVADLEGGAYLNIGSAVVLPEVFLKALTAVRNLGHKVDHFTTANFDFIQHYRPMTNVVNRPTAAGGKGYSVTGHHELMIPLLAAALIDEIESRE